MTENICLKFSEIGTTGLTFEVSRAQYGYLETCQDPMNKLGIKFIAERLNDDCTTSRLEITLTNIFFGTDQFNKNIDDNIDDFWQPQRFDVISYNNTVSIWTSRDCSPKLDLDAEMETFSEIITKIIKGKIHNLTVQKQAIILLGIKKRRVPALEWCDRFVIREISKLILKSGQIGLGEEGVKK